MDRGATLFEVLITLFLAAAILLGLIQTETVALRLSRQAYGQNLEQLRQQNDFESQLIPEEVAQTQINLSYEEYKNHP